jgi:NAD(P)-dependent dehydrogenase (short-subunit alcohol dehydrogenase family)
MALRLQYSRAWRTMSVPRRQSSDTRRLRLGISPAKHHRERSANVVQPGVMPTDMAAPLVYDLPEELLDMLAIRRVATLEEVAEAVCFLAGPNADYITGATLEVSGGYPI